MDDTNRPRRQNEPPFPGQDPRFSAEGQSRGFASSSDRYRPTPLTTPLAAARGTGGASTYQGYYQEPSSSFPSSLQSNSLQYQSSNYGHDQRQQQNFGPYNPEIMYNVTAQAAPTNLYDSTSQFQARQPAVMQILPDVATPYFASESNSAPVPPSSQHLSSGSSTVHQQHRQSPADRATLIPQSFSTHIAIDSVARTAEIIEDDEFQAQGHGMEAAYTAYQTALKEIFQNIVGGRLGEASQSLLEVSEWLLGHVGDLGLTVDEVALHDDRIRLWGEFNTAWLSIFQKQKDLLESGQRMQHPQNLMTQEFINRMAKDLIRMCDTVEKHGLVDYQYGVAEEHIISIITECLDLQEALESIDGAPSRAPP